MYRILIVDDEPFIRETLAAQLQFDGHSCVVAATGEDAMELLRYEEFDLVLTDLRMPKMGGIDFLDRIRGTLESVTPYVVVVGSTDLDNAIQAIQVGAFDFVQKPWEMQHLRLTVRHALQRREDLKFRRGSELELRRQIAVALDDVRAAMDETVASLAGLLAGRDKRTSDHCERVRDLSLRLGRRMGLPDDQLRVLERGALLHDIGKFKIPDAVLNKRGKLDEAEGAIMRRHPELGAEILAQLAPLGAEAEIVRCHHERWDGTGYPGGLRGEEIPLAARIVALAEAYDAITSVSPYAKRQSPEAAITELRGRAGTQFDPAVFDAFERIFPEVEVRTLAQRAFAAGVLQAGLHTSRDSSSASGAKNPTKEALMDELTSPEHPDVTSEPEWTVYVELRQEALKILEQLESRPSSPAQTQDQTLWARGAELIEEVRYIASQLERKGYNLRVDGTRIRVKGRLPPADTGGPANLPPGWRFVYCPHCGDPMPKPPAARVMELSPEVEIGCGKCGRSFRYGDLRDTPPA